MTRPGRFLLYGSFRRTLAAAWTAIALATPAALAAADVVANGSFAADTAGWSFVAATGAPSGSWEASGQSNGGAAKVSSPTGSQKAGSGRWEQTLASGVTAGSTVTLSYAWMESYAVKRPQQQDLIVSVVKPDGQRVDLDAHTGAPPAYDSWQLVADRDVSASFDQTGTYVLELRYGFKTGKHALAQATAAFDEVALEVTAALGTWVERAGTASSGAYGEAMAGTGDYLYVVRDSSATSDAVAWRYDPASDAWGSRSTTGLPTGAFRNGATLTWDGGSYVYALGGARYSDDDRRLFFRYDIAGDAWSQVADTPAAQGAGDATTWSQHDGRLYAILGSGQHGTAFAVYDPGNDTWTSKTSPPAGTDDGCSLAWAGGTHLFALRGEFLESDPLQDFWRYDIESDAWATMAAIPEVDGVGDGGSLAWLGDFDEAQNGVLYALGGGDPAENPGFDAYRYTVATDEWERLPDLPYPVGNYNGNRLGFAGGFLHYWQGAPASFDGGGDRVARFELA